MSICRSFTSWHFSSHPHLAVEREGHFFESLHGDSQLHGEQNLFSDSEVPSQVEQIGGKGGGWGAGGQGTPFLLSAREEGRAENGTGQLVGYLQSLRNFRVCLWAQILA